MNILYISSEYPPQTGYGGIATYTKYIAQGMAARKHSISVIALSDSSRESISYDNEIVVHRIAPLPYPLPSCRYAYPLRRFLTRSFPHTLNRICWAMAVGRKIRQLLLDDHRFDIIEAPECGAEGLFVSDYMCKKRVVRLHTPWEMIRILDGIKEPRGDRLMLPFLEKYATRQADAVSAPSYAIAQLLQRQWSLSNIAVIPNPLPVFSFLKSEGKFWIYTGRIERRKGVHHLISAYAKVIKKGRQAPSLKLIGRAYGTDSSGIDYGNLIRSLIAFFGIGERVTWIENARLDEISHHLQDAAVAFFPSLWENFPYTCLEAMSSGCAVVATNCGGFPEIIVHNESGLLVNSDSDEAIVNAMLMLLDNPELVRRLGHAARKRAEKLVSIECVCRDMELFYLQLQEK